MIGHESKSGKTAGTGWTFVPHNEGLALQVTGSDEPVMFAHNTLVDVALVAQVQLESRAVRLDVRANGTDAYTATLDMVGNVSLYRSGVVLATTTVAPPVTGTWQTLRLSAIGDIVRVSVDGVEVLAVQDTQPLSGGTVSFATIGGGTLRVDDVEIWWANGIDPTPVPTEVAENTGEIRRQAPNGGDPIQLMGNDPLEFNIPAGDVSSLISAMENCGTNSDVIVHLAADSTYTITQNYQSTQFALPQILGCMLTIDGNGAIIERSPSAPSFSMIWVALDGNLILDEVTIRGGQFGQNSLYTAGILVTNGTLWIRNNSVVTENTVPASVSGIDRSAAGIWFQSDDDSRTLTIENSEISHNQNFAQVAQQSYYIFAGGVGMHGGTLIIRNSEITDNTSTGGGGGVGTAIARVSAVRRSYLDVDNTNFRNNTATLQGDAVFWESQGDHFINQSCIFPNQLIPGSISHVSVYRNYAGSLDATENWWGPVNASDGHPGNLGGDPGNDTLIGAFAYTTNLSAPPPNAQGFPDCTGSGNNLATIEGIIAELADYGIIADASGIPEAWWSHASGTSGTAIPWNLDELTEVLTAVQDTAQAFNLFLNGIPDGTSVQAQTLYRTIMASTNMYLLRVQNDFVFGTDDHCAGPNSINAACTNNYLGGMAFYGDVTVTRFTMVHELGHRFEGQNGQRLLGFIQAQSTAISCEGVCIADYGGELVMGTGRDNQWHRGERGWGSGPANVVTNFQQHPPHDSRFTDDVTLTQMDETAADMFLNWVYRTISNPPQNRQLNQDHPGTWDGFLNVDWRAITNCYTSEGCDDDTFPGDARISWMDSRMRNILSPPQ